MEEFADKRKNRTIIDEGTKLKLTWAPTYELTPGCMMGVLKGQPRHSYIGCLGTTKEQVPD